MKGLILTEGGRSIGYGHITRSLSLYQAFEEAGVEVKLVVNGDPSVENLLDGVSYEPLDWLRAWDSLERFCRNYPSFVVVDSYLAPYEFYERVSRHFQLRIFVDDYHRLNYPDGIILNSSIYANTIGYGSRERLLLGPRYMPLRRPFWRIGEKPIRERVKRILVTFGGTDTARVLTEMVVEFLAREYPEVEKVIIIGGGSEKKGGNLKQLSDPHTEIFINPDGERIKELMYDSDMAISGGGQTLYELARVGVPTIGVCLSDNQKMNLTHWERIGFVRYVGWCHDEKLIPRIAKSIQDLDDRKRRLESSLAGRRFVDGMGGKRVVNALMEMLEDGVNIH